MKETAMTNLRQLLQRLRAKESKRMISTSMEMHRRVIRKMHKIAVEKEWLNPDAHMPSDDEIERAWSLGKAEKEEHVLNPYREKIIFRKLSNLSWFEVRFLEKMPMWTLEI